MASIVKRKNRYSVVYTYKDDDGNQHQKWETFDTNADAKKRKTQIEFEQQSGTFIIPNATTVADLLEEYCSVYGVNNWAMSTYRSKKGLSKTSQGKCFSHPWTSCKNSNSPDFFQVL